LFIDSLVSSATVPTTRCIAIPAFTSGGSSYCMVINARSIPITSSASLSAVATKFASLFSHLPPVKHTSPP
ncbi:hypothetical protein PMAYCL1PPCAC_03909, partial [Pristionchus mayeri]